MAKENLTANPPAPATHPRTGAMFFARDEAALTACLTALEDFRRHVEFTIGQTKKVLPEIEQGAISNLLKTATLNGGDILEILRGEFAKTVPAPAHVDPAKWAEILIYPPELAEVATLWREAYNLKKATHSLQKMAVADVLYIDKGGRVHLTEAAHTETILSPYHTTWIPAHIVDAYKAALAYVEAARQFEVVTGLRVVNTKPERRPPFMVGGGNPGDWVDVNPQTLELNVKAGYLP